ncbi:MAG: alanine racemase [Actinobacteria bacterium]|nr:alanine racemase [Actinomycetota bacterium]
MPFLLVDTEAIGRNTEVVAGVLRSQAIDLIGVTKGCLGEPRVGAAMLAGGAVALADTRDWNLRRIRSELPDAELHRIYLPSLEQEFEPGDVSYVSSLEGAATIAALPGANGKQGRHRIMLQVETGDLREGVPQEQLLGLARAVEALPQLDLRGISTNYACFQGAAEGIRASVENIAVAARDLRAAGVHVEHVSGGNSSLLWLLARGEKLPGEITEVRCGEALLLGQDALFYEPLAGCSQQACVIRAEVLEEYTKPAREASRRRLIIGVGRQDLGAGSVFFVDGRLRELGRSADYLVVELATQNARSRVGEMIDMVPSYQALVAAWTSPYVELMLQ